MSRKIEIINNWTLPRIFQELENGNMRIPRFQRAYVWERTKIVSLLNSMTQLHIVHLRNDIDKFLKTTEEGNSDGRKETAQKNVAVNVAEELTERQRIIIGLIEKSVAQNVAVNTKYLSEKLGVNRKTIQRDMAYLQEKKLIKWVGSDKTGHWETIKEK